MKIRTKMTKKTVCRKCKKTFLSVDHSKCPVCSEKNRELAAKREENRRKREQVAVAENIKVVDTEENAEG